MVKLLEGRIVRFGILSFLFFILWISLKYDFQKSILQKNFLSKFTQFPSSSSSSLSSSSSSTSSSTTTTSSSSKSIPTIARVLYLFLCENQNEINAYAKVFPSITADVMFLCWRQNCIDNNFSKLPTFYTMKWSGWKSNYQPFVQLDPLFNYIMIKPRVFIINERQLNLTRNTTWTTARNMLFERALVEERQQGWRWAYFNFGDGDIQVDCPLAQKLLKTNQTTGDELVIAQHFRSLINIEQSLNIKNKNNQCFILFDTFLLSVSPAISAIAGMATPTIFDDLLTQIVYHIDAMFNAFHRDAIPFVLPYCARYDSRTWWTSQAILIYRSICLYGHVIQFNAVYVTGEQKHRKYPRKGNAWAIDEDMNLIPSSLIPLKNYMKQSRIVSPLVLQHYHGWSLEMTSSECRNGHTFVNPITCKVGEKKNKTNFW